MITVENKEDKIIEVWLTSEEVKTVDRNQLADNILLDKDKKYKVVFFLPGKSDLLECTKQLLIHNL